MQDLKITGEVVRVLEEQSGTGRNGPWRKQEFILETQGDYPKQVCIVQWGDDIDEFDVREGETLTAHVDIRSREYEGRWYTDVKAWRVERNGGSGSGGPGDPAGDLPDGPPVDDRDDDLPF